MKLRVPILAAVLFSCLSCITVDNELGANLLPNSHKYRIVSAAPVPLDLKCDYVDSLSGWSTSRIVIGDINEPSALGRTSRYSVVTLVPLHDSLDFGDPGTAQFICMHFGAGMDSISVSDKGQARILQRVNVYPLKKPLYATDVYSCNEDINLKDYVDYSKRITRGIPVINGTDSLSFDFSAEYGKKYMEITSEDLKDFKQYMTKFPGFCISTDTPAGEGGRINMFKLQVGYSSTDKYITGNYASLTFTAKWDGVDSLCQYYFYYSPNKFYNLDSLFSSTTRGNFPEYCFNHTGQDKAKTDAMIESMGGKEKCICVEGGGGYKPMFSAAEIRRKVMSSVKDSLLAIGRDLSDTANIMIHKATLVMPYEKSDANFSLMYRFPDILSPNIKTMKSYTVEGKTVKKETFEEITDSSSSSEDAGDINRSTMCYAPDITYHLQELLRLEAPTADTLSKYDVWFLVKAYETVVTESSSSTSDDYYNYLAYQNYYNSIYGDGYGYGDYYTNSYSYALAALYASGTVSTSESLVTMMDNTRYYRAILHGPKWSENVSEVPRIEFSYSIPLSGQ